MKGLYDQRDELEDRVGSWVMVEYEQIEGYVFSGFLGQVELPNFRASQHGLDNSWWIDLVKLNTNTSICELELFYKGFDPDKGGGKSNIKLYSNGTIIREVVGYESVSLVVETDLLNMNDLLNIIEYYSISKIACDVDFYEQYQEETPKVNFEKDVNGYISEIECHQLGIHAKNVIGNVSIFVNIE